MTFEPSSLLPTGYQRNFQGRLRTSTWVGDMMLHVSMYDTLLWLSNWFLHVTLLVSLASLETHYEASPVLLKKSSINQSGLCPSREPGGAGSINPSSSWVVGKLSLFNEKNHPCLKKNMQILLGFLLVLRSKRSPCMQLHPQRKSKAWFIPSWLCFHLTGRAGAWPISSTTKDFSQALEPQPSSWAKMLGPHAIKTPG